MRIINWIIVIFIINNDKQSTKTNYFIRQVWCTVVVDRSHAEEMFDVCHSCLKMRIVSGAERNWYSTIFLLCWIFKPERVFRIKVFDNFIFCFVSCPSWVSSFCKSSPSLNQGFNLNHSRTISLLIFKLWRRTCCLWIPGFDHSPRKLNFIRLPFLNVWQNHCIPVKWKTKHIPRIV